MLPVSLGAELRQSKERTSRPRGSREGLALAVRDTVDRYLAGHRGVDLVDAVEGLDLAFHELVELAAGEVNS